jgi:hypothetical protein
LAYEITHSVPIALCVEAVATLVCERCGADDPSLVPGRPPVCDRCVVTTPTAALHGRLEPGDLGKGPVLRVGGRRIPWSLIGEVLAGQGGVGLTLTITPEHQRDEPVVIQDGTPDMPGMHPRPPLRAPVDELEAESWEAAVTLLGDSLRHEARPCPVADLHAACARARGGAAAGDPPWPVVAEAAGWIGAPPDDDVDLWTGAAMALVSVAVDGLDDDAAECLDAMELNDWLATIIELVRSGPGTAARPDSLLPLSARCLDVDSAAVDADLAPVMAVAFGAVQPVWRALGAVDDGGCLTPLGAWGLPLALARAWGGWIG